MTSHGLGEAVWLGHTWSLLASTLAVKMVYNKIANVSRGERDYYRGVEMFGVGTRHSGPN